MRLIYVLLIPLSCYLYMPFYTLPYLYTILGYGSLPRSNHSDPSHRGMRMDAAFGALGSSTSLPLSTLSSPYCPEYALPVLETLEEDSPRVEDKGWYILYSFPYYCYSSLLPYSLTLFASCKPTNGLCDG